MNKFLLKIHSSKIQYICFAVLMVVFVSVDLWKTRYGFPIPDETFYVTIPHRILQGDAFFIDEWHLSQMTGFLQIPFVWTYEFITKSTVGIILFMRICYVLFHTAIAIFVYIRLRKYGYIAIVTVLLYFIFTPFDIITLNYNTVGMDMLVFTGAIMATADVNRKIPFIISGVSFSAVVLCCPFMTIVYILFVLVVFMRTVFEKKQIKIISESFISTDIFSLRIFLNFSLGVVISFVGFMTFVLSRTSIGNIIKNVPYLLSDPEHSETFWDKITFLVFKVVNFHNNIEIPIISFLILLIFLAFDKKRGSHRVLYLLVVILISTYTELLYKEWAVGVYYNAIISPAFFIGMISYLLLKNKPQRLFVSIFLVGTLYAFIMPFSSNLHILIFTMGFSISNIASFIFTGLLLKEIYDETDSKKIIKAMKNISLVLFILYICCQGILQICVKIYHCFGEVNTSLALKNMIDKGPVKGIYTNEDYYNHYSLRYDDIMAYNIPKGKKVLFITDSTWTYLVTDKCYNSAFSAWAWIYYYGECLDKQNDYYLINRDKIPDYVYVKKFSDISENKKERELFNDLKKKGYVMTENNLSYMFKRK